MQERHQVGWLTQQPLQQFLRCIPSGAHISYLKPILKTKFPNVAIWSSGNLDAHPRGSQPAARQPSSCCRLMFCLTEERDPWPRFSATLGPHWRWHSTPPLRKESVCECVCETVCAYVKKNDRRKMWGNAGTDRCVYLDISSRKRRKTNRGSGRSLFEQQL